MDIVFVFDTSGSMGGEINELRSIVSDFADDLHSSRVDYNLGLVEFRDFPKSCGMSKDSGCGKSDDFAYRVKGNGDLTSDINTFSSWLAGLKADGGADKPEAILAALRHALTDSMWRSDSEKMMILLTDAGPHPDGDCCNDEGDTLDGTIFGLTAEGVRVHVIGPDDAAMKKIAGDTGGRFFTIRSGLSLKPLLKEITDDMGCTFRPDVEATCTSGRLKVTARLQGNETIPYVAGETAAWAYLNQSGRSSQYNLSYDTVTGTYIISVPGLCGPAELAVYGRVGERSAVQTAQVDCGSCGGATVAEATSNQPPEIVSLLAKPSSPQEAGAAVTWTAEATDTDGDQILYRFFVNDEPATEWNTQNQWTWTASEAGTYRVEVQVRDGRHAGEGGMDDRKVSSFEISGTNEPQTTGMSESDEVVVFPDPNLDAAIRTAINKPEGSIYAADLVDLNVLHSNSSSIKDLTGLEHCNKLQELHLYDNRITDVSPLSDLTSLTYLDLSGLWQPMGVYDKRITDVSPLSGLTNLTWLDLSYNQITDVSPLSGLTNLQELDLSENQITDVSPLSGLTSLTHLGLFYNQITDVSPLSGLTNLQDLHLDDNQITDVSPLSGLTNLQELGLMGNQITDVSPLSGLTNLQELELGANQITDVSPLSSLTSLTRLSLRLNWITDVSPLSCLTNLTWLDLCVNQITDISPLSGLTSLQSLELYRNQITDVSPLSGLTSLTYLDLRENQITDVSSLSGFINLQALRLSYNQITDVSPLSGLTNLQELHLYDNRITDVSPLSGLTSLTYLDLRENQITDTSPLSGLACKVLI
ncbi:MAG TPA: leucine-rich repeat domain-containing protein [Methanothrix sp.]|nr:leucine-rich repeat domain-containing protein [Methanothrix sp.]HPC89416.1 leucine-rich repeat domain-containing protein [Methanothrix sp.]